MKAITITVIVIAVLVLAAGLWYTQTHMAHSTQTPSPTPTAPTPTTATATPTLTAAPTLTPTTPASTVTGNLSIKGVNAKPGSNDWVILINGTVTNDSPNTAYGVGLHVFSEGDPALYPFEETVDVTVPAASGTYNATNTYGLSTIPPNQSIPINIEIIPPAALGEWRVTENAAVTVVWSNTPT